MSRWFRWYEGTCEDGKFRMVARNAGVTVATVMGVWAIILEDAAHVEHRGKAMRGSDYYAEILGMEDADLLHVLQFMEAIGLLSVKVDVITITNWKERQFETDATDPTNSDRQRRWREKHKPNTSVTECNGNQTERNGPKTPETETETYTETEKKDSRAVVPTRTKPNSEFEEFWKEYPRRQGSPDKQSARKSFEKLVKAGTIAADLVAASRNFAAEIRTLGKENTEFVPMAATWLNKQRHLDYLAGPPVSSGISDAEREKLFAQLRGSNGQKTENPNLRSFGARSCESEGVGQQEPTAIANDQTKHA